MKLWRVGRGENGVTSIESVRDLSEEEAEAYLRSCQHLHDFERARDMLLFVAESLEAFRAGIAEHRERMGIERTGPLNQDPRPRRRLQRLAVDFLNAMRLYLDHRQTHLSRRYGHESAVLAAFDGARRAVHDQEPVYRFAYELRNFAQHCGMPLQALRARQQLVRGEGGGTVLTEVFVGFSKQELLQEYDAWRHGRAFIDLQPDEFEALPVFEQTMRCLWKIEEAAVAALLPDLWRDAKRVSLLMQQGTDSRGVGLPAEIGTDDPSVGKSTIAFKAPPFAILSWLKFITMLNEAPGIRFNDAMLALHDPPQLTLTH